MPQALQPAGPMKEVERVSQRVMSLCYHWEEDRKGSGLVTENIIMI